jgi:hypothetical protein
MSQVSTIQTNQLPREQGNGGLAHLLYGTLGKLACKCSTKNDVDFLIKKDKIICACCGSEVQCMPPLVGVYVATCDCCASAAIKSTFILDARGIYTCTWCGRTR